MKTKILTIAVVALSFAVIILMVKPARVEVQQRVVEHHEKIRELEIKIVSYDSTITSMRDSMTTLIGEIEQQKIKIKKLNKINNEKTAAINNMHGDELIRVLTNRYK